MEYKKGDKVRFKDAAGIAVVSRIVGNIIYIEDDAGFEHEYESHELLPFRTMEVGYVPIKDKTEPARAVSAQQISGLTIDLHSHVLLENTYGMTKYEILNYQLDKARQTINEAKRI